MVRGIKGVLFVNGSWYEEVRTCKWISPDCLSVGEDLARQVRADAAAGAFLAS